MNRRLLSGCGVVLLGLLAACGTPTAGIINPYLTLANTFGVTPTGVDRETEAGGSVTPAGGAFRRNVRLLMQNIHSAAQVETFWIAWVEAGSVRSPEQQDDLLRAGYTRLTAPVAIGSVFTLPVGTYVYNGPGLAGATPVRLGIPGARVGSPTYEISLLTPDALLVFSQPPVSCDSVAWRLLDSRGNVLPGPVSGPGGFKTLAQVDVYQCEPLRPGLFLRVGGGRPAPNEYLEGDTILFIFSEGADAVGNFAFVRIGTDVTFVTTSGTAP